MAVWTECMNPAITPFLSQRKNFGVGNSDNIMFNHTIAKTRAKLKHINGMLKSRFPGVIRKLKKYITEENTPSKIS